MLQSAVGKRLEAEDRLAWTAFYMDELQRHERVQKRGDGMKIVIKEIDGSVIGNKVNLCDSCKHDYPVCVAGSADVLFGDGEGNDNVCCCALYAPIKCKREVTE